MIHLLSGAMAIKTQGSESKNNTGFKYLLVGIHHTGWVRVFQMLKRKRLQKSYKSNIQLLLIISQVTDIFTIDINKMVLSDKVSAIMERAGIILCAIKSIKIHLFIKTFKNIFKHGVLQYGKTSSYKMSFNVSEAREWVPQYRKMWNKVESQLFEN